MRLLHASFLLASALVACGSRTALLLGDSPSDGVGGGVDGGSSTEGGAAGGVVLPPGATRFGLVGVVTTAGNDPGAWADFQPAGSEFGACDYFGELGRCQSLECYGANVATENGGPIIAVGAGGGLGAIAMYGVENYPTAQFSDLVSFEAGNVVDFFGQGANDVPAFMSTATTPSFVTLTSPSSATTTTVARGDDLALTWPPLGIGDAFVVVTPITTSSTPPTVRCLFDGSAGAGSIPSSVLAAVRTETPDGKVGVVLNTISRSLTTVDDWAINSVALATPAAGTDSSVVILQ